MKIPGKDLDSYKIYIKTSAVGIEIALSIIVGTVAGYFIDKHFLISPYCLIVGFVCGCLAAGKRLYGFAKQWLIESKKSENDEGKNDPRS